MLQEVYMPKNGMDMTEGTLIRWLKQVGDHVEQGEPIAEIETDKVTMEAESPASGTLLKKLYEDGAVVPVLTTIGYLGEAGDTIPENPFVSVEPSADSRESSPTFSQQNAYQVAIIGGGPAGYVAAIRAAQLGAGVVLFERDAVGGTCLNRGCIPTKAFLKAAECLTTIQGAASKGIVVSGTVKADLSSIVTYKNKVVKTLTSGVKRLLSSNGITVVVGEGRLASEHTIICGQQCYTAEKIILCGGSKAVRIPIPGVDHPNVLTSTELLDLQQLPKRLCIIGGGVIGCELASAFCAFGTQVTIVEQLDRLVANMDRSISEAVEYQFKRQGISLRLHETVARIEEQAGEMIVVTEQGSVVCDKVLLSIGRRADLSCLGDLESKLKIEHGAVLVDETMRTSIPNIYACGDINGRSMLAHSASKMAETAAENCATNQDTPCDLRYIPSILYTLPEAASIGLTEDQARSRYPGGIRVGRFPMTANSRAVIYEEPEGFVKVIADQTYGELLGVHIVGPMASEMIAEPLALMAAEATVEDAAFHMIHGHPSYSEAFMEACKDIFGAAIHIPPKS